MDGTHLPGSNIANLLVARDGTLWIGTREDREGTIWAGGSVHSLYLAGRLGWTRDQRQDVLLFSYEGLRLRQPLTEETVVPDSTSRQQAPAAMQPYLSAYAVANGLSSNRGWRNSTPAIRILPR
jgi:hypothetical protein